MELILTRVTYAKDGTLGVLHDADNAYCVTLEDPWNNNQRGISCIPTGRYKVTPHSGTRFKNVWILHEVPNRTAILIHAGNTQADTQGCILVGTSFVPDETKITGSKVALDNLRLMLPKEFYITIRDFQSRSGPSPSYNKPQAPRASPAPPA